MEKVLCIYHKADLDGAASAAVVLKAYPDADIFGWDYYEETPIKLIFGKSDCGKCLFDKIILVDISFPYHLMNSLSFKLKENFIWIDHHKSAISDMGKLKINGIREVGTAACELTHKYFFPDSDVPELIQYLSAYDVWDKDRFDWEDVMNVQYGARAMFGLDPRLIYSELTERQRESISYFTSTGNYIRMYIDEVNERVFNQNYFMFYIGRYLAVGMNTTEFNSNAFKAFKGNCDLMVPFCMLKDGRYKMSLYSEDPNIDCSVIAAVFGGGGHRGAAGFISDECPKPHSVLTPKFVQP